MAWIYECNMDGHTLSADSKEQLADKVMRHANQEHNMNMTRDQAMDSVNKSARQREV